MKSPNKYNKIIRARELRKKLTKPEQILWEYLRDRKFFGKKFRRQHIVSGFILDFYCPENKLAIELDGPVHYRQKEYDYLRQNLIQNNGIIFLRFKNRQITDDIKNTLKTIKRELNPSPLKMEKGVKIDRSIGIKQG
jgi:very-short-patch-repair endonuclease